MLLKWIQLKVRKPKPLLKHGLIDFEYDKKRYGKYGRLLAWVWRYHELLQEELIKTKYAEMK